MAKRKAKKRRRREPARLPKSRAIEAALAGIAHDVRTPLTGIVALAEMLATADIGPREREWANAIKSGADHLTALTSLIVDAVKADAAGLVLQHEPFSPRDLAEAVGRALSARAGNKDVKAEIDIAPDLPALVIGDPLRLRAALENLADNAVKFTRVGVVRLSVRAEGARGKQVRLVFTVADSGIGLSAAELKLLFRPFAQASEAVARRYGGAGLGLVFVKRIAKAMGGDLAVTSKQGSGSVFTLTALVDVAGPIRSRPGPMTVLCVRTGNSRQSVRPERRQR
jgi:two-component system, sensor histidine kinase